MNQVKIEFLKSVLETNMELNDVAHESADFLAGLSGIIMAITLTQIFSATGLQRIGFIIISLTCFIVIFFSIGIIRPKIGVDKNNLMYYKGILRLLRKEYTSKIISITKNERKIIEEFANEIYDLSMELREKNKMIKRGADILATGLFIGILFVFVA